MIKVRNISFPIFSTFRCAQRNFVRTASIKARCAIFPLGLREGNWNRFNRLPRQTALRKSFIAVLRTTSIRPIREHVELEKETKKKRTAVTLKRRERGGKAGESPVLFTTAKLESLADQKITAGCKVADWARAGTKYSRNLPGLMTGVQLNIPNGFLAVVFQQVQIQYFWPGKPKS